MNANFEQSLAWLLKDEGGYVNNPHDSGGMTNLGVTWRAWVAWCIRKGDGVNMGNPEAVIRSLTPEIVAPFYRDEYWDKVRADDLPAGIDYCVFDCAVNSGPHFAALILQDLVGTGRDGIIGPITLSKLGGFDETDFISAFCAERLACLKQLVTRWRVFGQGWTSRIDRVQERAYTLQ